MKLKDLVAYQSGAVVSKTLLGAEEGTVTAFAFDEGQGLVSTRHPTMPWSSSSKEKSISPFQVSGII